MKANLKEQVAELQSSVQELTKRNATLQDRIENYLVPLLQKHDKEIVALQSLEERIKQMEQKLVDLKDKFWQDETLSRISKLEDWRTRTKSVNATFFDQFSEFVSGMDDTTSPVKAMTLYQEMISKFLNIAKEKVIQSEDDSK